MVSTRKLEEMEIMRKINLADIRTMAEAAVGNISALYLHWSAGHYGQYFDDYHITS
jgi:hypothetical protein